MFVRLADILYGLMEPSPLKRFWRYCALGRQELAEAVLPKVKDFNQCTEHGQSTAEFVCTHDLAGLVVPLLRAGWNPEHQAASGWNALTVAVDVCALKVQQALHQAKVDANMRNGVTRMTAAMYAARQEKPEALRLLASNGADLDLQDKNGWTAAHWTVHKDKLSIIPELAKLGAGLDIEDEWGQTPIECAFKEGKPMMVAILAEQLNKGGTLPAAIRHAAAGGHAHLTEALSRYAERAPKRLLQAKHAVRPLSAELKP